MSRTQLYCASHSPLRSMRSGPLRHSLWKMRIRASPRDHRRRRAFPHQLIPMALSPSYRDRRVLWPSLASHPDTCADAREPAREPDRYWPPGRHGSSAAPCRDFRFSTSDCTLGVSPDWRRAIFAWTPCASPGPCAALNLQEPATADIPRMLARSARAGQKLGQPSDPGARLNAKGQAADAAARAVCYATLAVDGVLRIDDRIGDP